MMKLKFIAIAAALTMTVTAGAQKHLVLPDSLDYAQEFWKKNAEASQRARREMPWGKMVPRREWDNFVVPVRVNNEALDTARVVFYRELAPRVRNMSMTEAALEVNHWCHEKVTYRPSDSRTSPPLSTLRTSWGRCGEESTFTVAALRSVGIPARQVYTPRWAHTDDNHAWVEVWTDGKWHFLGACEPEPIMNLAWFNAPASRGMLMNTKVYNGAYDGPEEVLSRNEYFTEINVTDNYAPTDTVRVQVLRPNGSPAAGVTVLFTLYNYGEFYTVARKTTDKLGKAWLTTGLGDMLLWVYDSKGNYNYSLYNGSKSHDMATIVLGGQQPPRHAQFTITPPKQSASLPKPTPRQAADNDRRKAYEDSIRLAYMATFYTPETAREYAVAKGFNPVMMADLLPKTYGNHKTITDFLESVPDDLMPTALRFLHTLSEKDLRDIEPSILADHFFKPARQMSLSRCAESDYINYVMCPRVTDEPLTAYRSFFDKEFTDAERKLYSANPQKWVARVKKMIKVDRRCNPTGLPMSPMSVWKHRRDIDSRSRDIFFVASSRSLGIPARIDPVTSKPQLLEDGTWKEVVFEAGKKPAPQGTLCLTYDGKGTMADPLYYYHFSLSHINNGCPTLLNFDEGAASWSNTFAKEGYPLDKGSYLLVSGQRMADGSVLADLSIVDVNANRKTTAPLTMRIDTTGTPQVIGSFNSENLWYDPARGSERSILDYTGRGYYVVGLIRPSHEPSAHVINDLRAQAAQVAKWPVKVLLLAESKEALSRFRPETLEGLPSNVAVGALPEGSPAIAEINPADMPALLIADSFNRVVFRSEGYTISLPERLWETLRKLQ